MVDQRQQPQFILERARSMKEMGYLKKLPDAKILDGSLLEKLIAENRPLFDGLQFKST